MGAMLMSMVMLASQEWRQVLKSDGVTVEAREKAGSRFAELRATTTEALPAEALCAGAFGNGLTDKREPTLTWRKVLSETQDERVTFERTSASIVSDREYAVRTRRVRGDGGKCRVVSEIANELAPPKSPGAVRIEQLACAWDFEPTPSGDTHITYVVSADPKTSLPAFLVEPSLRRIAAEWVKLVIERARAWKK
jgi:hypothetical protein